MVNQRLRARLIAIAKKDQDMRKAAIIDPTKWDRSLDKENTRILKLIIKKYGWPTIPSVGPEASNSAWLIAQHADHDLAFQKHCLAILKSLPTSDVNPVNIAYLEDRILNAEGRPQLYGTQYRGKSARYDPAVIYEPEHLDDRRREIGLEPYAEYEKRIIKTYGTL